MRPVAWVGLLVLSGCVGSAGVARVYEDRSVEGRYIDVDAYAAFLRGALAEGSGDARAALAAYEQAARVDPDGPEIWARVGALRCRIDAADREADRAFARAVALDPHLGRAWEAMARCARARGDEALARSDEDQAARLDSRADQANAALDTRPDRGGEDVARRSLVALTLTAPDKVLAWDTLAAWAESHGDVALRTEALEALVRVAPSRRLSVARAAEALAAGGHLAEARAVAAAAVAASPEPLDEPDVPLAARLAVDEALVRGDVEQARARATEARVSLEEVAGRALLLGQLAAAKQIASEVAAADPGSIGARLVLAASAGGDLLGVSRFLGEGATAAVSGASLVAFGEVLVHAVSPAEARETLARIGHRPFVPGDDRVVRGAIALVSRGVLDAAVVH